MIHALRSLQTLWMGTETRCYGPSEHTRSTSGGQSSLGLPAPVSSSHRFGIDE